MKLGLYGINLGACARPDVAARVAQACIFGVAAGYLEAEFRAIGAPFEERGAHTDELVACAERYAEAARGAP
jgi:hypothetical protein